MSVPNQIIVRIQKPRYEKDFLQIGIDEWIYAVNKFPPVTFKIYLYLAGNADGFNLELSQQAIENKLGLKKTSYHDSIAILKETGYLKQLQGNVWTFSPAIPEGEKIKDKSADAEGNNFSAFEEYSSAIENKSSAKAIEKQITDNIDIIDKSHHDSFFDFLSQDKFVF